MAVVGTKGCKCTSPNALCKRQIPQKEPDKPGDVQRADETKPEEKKTVGEVPVQPSTDIQQAATDSASGAIKERTRGRATCACTKPDAPCKVDGKSSAPPVQGLSKCVCPSEGSPCKVTSINWDICQGTCADAGKDDLDTDLGALLLDEQLLQDGPTINELQASLAVMQNKCRVKDQLITALTDELQLHAKSGVFENLLSNVCTDPYTAVEPPRDFDRVQLCEFLKRPENYNARPPPHHLEPVSAEGRKVGCPPSCPGIKDCVKDGRTDLIPCPGGLKVHRRVGVDGLLLGWNVPQDAEFVGYERQQFRKELNKSIENLYSVKLENMNLAKEFENLQNYVSDLQILKRQIQEKQDRTVVEMSKIMLELQNELAELRSRMAESTPFCESEKVENDDNLNKMATSHDSADICGCFSSRGMEDSSSTSSLQFVDGRKCSCNGGSSSFQVQSNKAPEMELSRASYSNNRGTGSMLCETSDDCKCLVSAVLDTVLRLTASLAVLQNKCRTKDRMIQSLADELNGRSLSGVFDNLLTNLALDDSAFPSQPYDFDRIRLCEYLKKPTGLSRNSMQSQQRCIPPCPKIERFSPFDDTRMFSLEDNVLMIPCKAPCSMKRSNVDEFTSECEDICKAPCSKKQQSNEPFMCDRTCEASCSTERGSRNGSDFIYNNPQQQQQKLNSRKAICMNGRMKGDSKLTITITPKNSFYDSRTNNTITPRKISKAQSPNGKDRRQTMTSFSGACNCSQSSQPEYSGRGSLKTSKISFNGNDVFSSTRKNGGFSNTGPLSSSPKKYSNPSIESRTINPYADCIPKEVTSAKEIRDSKVCIDDQSYSGYGMSNVPANLEPDPNIPPPMDLEVLHLTSIEALLISWIPPRIQDLHGYEVYMDGSMVKNVTRHRTTALLRGIECSCDVAIRVFTLTRTGRSLEAATCNVPFIKNRAFPDC